MAQHDMNIADGSGAVVRSDLNGALEALATCQMGDTAPSPTWPLMWWGDTTNGLLKQRNAANTAWISRADLVGQFLQLSGGSYPAGTGENIDLSNNADVLSLVGYPPGFVWNATVSVNSADSEHDLDVPKFSLRNDANSANIDAASALTKKMDAAFSEGSNVGGMASGQSLPASDFFYVFAVTKDSDGTVDVMGDTDSGGANINAGWTAEKMIARVSTDASSNIKKVVNYLDDRGRMVFDSDEQSIVSGGQFSLSHGLSRPSIDARIKLVCVAAEQGYSVGDVLDLSAYTPMQGASGSIGCGLVVRGDSVVGQFGNYISNVFGIPRYAGGAVVFLTVANWRVIVRAS